MHVLQGAEHDLDATGALALPLLQHLLDHLALQVLLRTAQVAGDDGKFLELAVGLDIGLGTIGQRADHHVAAIVGEQLGRHGLERAAVEHVEEEGFQNVVAVVPQRHLGRTDLVGVGVQGATTQARAQRAGGLALGDLLFHHRVGVLLDDVVLHTNGFQIGRQHMLGETGLLLIHVHRDDLELDRRHLLQVQQHVEHGVAVLAAGQADHHLVAILDHVEVGDGFAGQAANALLQFVLVDRKGAHGASKSEG